jgi:hypothetical protein
MDWATSTVSTLDAGSCAKALPEAAAIAEVRITNLVKVMFLRSSKPILVHGLEADCLDQKYVLPRKI